MTGRRVEHTDTAGAVVWCESRGRLDLKTLRARVAVVDTDNGRILKQIEVGSDIHTLAATYDGKYIVGVFSGHQTTESGLFILDARTDELVGFLPSPGGHHDCVIVPRTNADLRYSRSTTT